MRDHRSFSFYARKSVIYVRFWDPFRRTYGPGQSTGTKDRKEAEFSVRAYISGLKPSVSVKEPFQTSQAFNLRLGFLSIHNTLETMSLEQTQIRKLITILLKKVSSEESLPLNNICAFLEAFWNFDTSSYVQGRLKREKSISRHHCYDMLRHVKGHWKIFFPLKSVLELQPKDLEFFALHLSEKGLAGKTVNNILNAGITAFNWAHEKGLILENPAKGWENFAVNNVERGILEPNEVFELFSIKWEDPYEYLGNLLGYLCGLRAGEIVALRYSDLFGSNDLNIVRAWNYHDGFTKPKWGSQRKTFFPERVLELASQLPHIKEETAGEDPLIFPGKIPGQPRDQAFLNDSLKTQLLSLNDDPDFWAKRRIVFHSWRHLFAKHLAAKTSDELAMKLTGHRTKSVFDNYKNHLSEAEISSFRQVQDGLLSSLGTSLAETPISPISESAQRLRNRNSAEPIPKSEV